jgi:proteasome accessory factor C
MAEPAPARLARLVHLIAWLSQRDTTAASYAAAARHLGVSEATVRDDLEALARLGERFTPWLASLSVAYTAGGFVLCSRGAFRRPFRLTPDEALALVAGLAGVRGGPALAAKLAAALGRRPVVARAAASVALGPSPSAHVEAVLGLARRAREERRPLAIVYCGSRGEARRRVIHVHQIVERQVWWYLIAWCEDARAFRHFRADRVLEATLGDGRFAPRPEFRPVTRADQVFRAADTVPATVAFSPAIARWLRERYPNGREGRDGRYLVTFRVADPAWFVREVLQYGAEAEVLEPAGLREAVRRAVG